MYLNLPAAAGSDDANSANTGATRVYIRPCDSGVVNVPRIPHSPAVHMGDRMGLCSSIKWEKADSAKPPRDIVGKICGRKLEMLEGQHSNLGAGRLHGQLRYSTEDCSFEEEIRPDGYNVYKSKKYGISVSLSSAKQRQQFKGKDFLPLSHFLPMINTVPVESTDFGEYGDYSQAFEPEVYSSPLETDSMDPFGITSKLSPVKSPSFQK
ncbi:PREDICTED: fibroblast growth factor 19 [Aptenodytes forsteri]|uniref:fibroblast growth factor 19 n=1 Tax=Aptenodytes forsteri TaxID=9233 RepID=UPI0004F4966F|nr:PREDICTED: fibroblast growth factor 19 [Aptenodytes forsteri]